MASGKIESVQTNQFIPISKPSITSLEVEYVNDAVASGWVSSQGWYLDAFEKAFAEYCGTRYAIAVANGTVGLHLALTSLGVGANDEVIVPDLTFIATANAVRYTGANVVFADVDPKTLCIDSSLLRALITKRTKAIVPVHLYGHPCDMDAINAIARDFGLFVVEDAAEAHGAEINGEKVGSLGTAGVFSFYGNKIMTTGEGGMITTDDEEFFIQARLLRDHAMKAGQKYWHEKVGYNYRMTNLQAALGLAQLKRIEELIAKKRLIFTWYKKNLGIISTVRLNCSAPNVRNVYWMVCIECEGITLKLRDIFIQELKSRGIDSRPYFYPVSDMPMYCRANTPIAHEVYVKGMNLPSFYDLEEDEVQYICDMIVEILPNIRADRAVSSTLT
jgi:perosamine synthetase